MKNKEMTEATFNYSNPFFYHFYGCCSRYCLSSKRRLQIRRRSLKSQGVQL